MRRRAQSNSTDVARLAGVSIAAVSRAFADGGSISPELAQRVYEAARQLNYIPNTLARSLITRETGIVALMLPNMSNPIFAALLEETSRRLEERGKQVLLFTPGRIEDFDSSLQKMLQFRVDAIVIAAAAISSRMAALCLNRGVPVVTMGRHLPGLPVHSVRGDDVDGGAQAAELMLGLGRRRLGLITGPSTLSTMNDRKSAILARLRDDPHAEPPRDEDGGLTYEGGYGAALRILQGGEPPDGLICLTDIMAVGAMDALRQARGLRVPEDVAVMGFDDIPEASHGSYDLTTVRTPVPEMVDAVLRLIATSDPGPPASVAIPSQVIVRSSTAGRTATSSAQN